MPILGFYRAHAYNNITNILNRPAWNNFELCTSFSRQSSLVKWWQGIHEGVTVRKRATLHIAESCLLRKFAPPEKQRCADTTNLGLISDRKVLYPQHVSRCVHARKITCRKFADP